ncbi:MAG TPA: hypothetical protein VL129_06970 [Pseudomonas sp.]|jgi:hypothetical protein|uniref:hypothetical protein n=1 Tax=Pseudomonas sp. TaxID=306 RepID=UPI002B59F342|nr:hypothetical protein [Pseudomonas sp.]HTO18872.1 hypothetical protein [Pseudomonas sp.]
MKLKGMASILFFSAVASGAAATVLPKNILSIKQHFDNVGATTCSGAISETLSFLAKGRDFSSNKAWSTENTNIKPIVVDFLISGTESNYSSSGTVVITPVEKQCVGAYVVTYVAPTPSCMAYIQKHGFDGAGWRQKLTDPNGDGGKTYFLSVDDSPGLNFIFNDVAGGCSITKRETLSLDAKK